MISFEGFSVDEIFYSAGSAHDNLDSSISEGLAVFSEIGASDETAGLHFEELTEAEDVFVVLEGELSSGSDDDRLTLWRAIVDSLEDSDGEGGGLAGS